MRVILEPSFFDRKAEVVGRALLGKYLVRIVDDREVAYPITEVEIYDGFEDRASHAFRGRTARNQVMFGDAGHLYIYLVYGMYFMLNVVVGKKDYPAAILIRGAGEINGPGKLTKKLEIGKKLNGKLAIPETGLWFEDRGKLDRRHWRVKQTTRIGISYAGKTWSEKLYRFVLQSRVKLKDIREAGKRKAYRL